MFIAKFTGDRDLLWLYEPKRSPLLNDDVETMKSVSVSVDMSDNIYITGEMKYVLCTLDFLCCDTDFDFYVIGVWINPRAVKV